MGKKNTTPYVNKALHIFTASPAPTLWIWITLWPRLHQAVPFCSTFKPSRCQHRDRRANRETNLTTQCGPANGCISQRSWAKNKKKLVLELCNAVVVFAIDLETQTGHILNRFFSILIYECWEQTTMIWIMTIKHLIWIKINIEKWKKKKKR